MTRAVALACALAAAATTTAAARPSASPPCSRTAAKAAILASAALRQAWPIVKEGGGVDSVICRDLTRDGSVDMAATIFSGGTAGDVGWAVFRRRAGRWTPAFRRLGVYKIGLFRVGGDLVESSPVYRQNDPNCCPSGGFDHRRYHWNGSRFVLAQRWHTKSFRP